MNEKNLLGFIMFFIQVINIIPDLSKHVSEDAWARACAKFNPIAQEILKDFKLLALNSVYAKFRCDNNHDSSPPSCLKMASPSSNMAICFTGVTSKETATWPLSICDLDGSPQ